MSTSVLEVMDVTKIYGKGETAFTALSQVDLAIHTGESVAIIGKSGSGKSTLMHILALLDKPTKGSIQIDGKNITTLSATELDLLRNDAFGFVFQQFFLNANATVLENVMLPLKIAGVPAAERRLRALEVLKSVDLDDKAGNRANDLSGGQKQRAVIARALINNPRVIFADEPTGNLDTSTGAKIEDLLFKLNKEQGITLVIVTHDEDLAKRCKRRVYIKDGCVVKGA
ncbi:ABC transporter ATP-binding protein [soil metagenome]